MDDELLGELLVLEIQQVENGRRLRDCRVWSQKHAQNGFWFINLSAVVDNTRLSTITTVAEPLSNIYMDFARCIIQNMVRHLVSHASLMLPLREMAMEDPLIYEEDLCVDWKEDGF